MTRARELSEIVTSTGLKVDTDTLVVDSANNRVGIGTSLPDYSLQVQETSPIVAVKSSGANTSRLLLSAEDDAVYIGTTYGGSNIPMIFSRGGTSSGTESMRIDSAGNVGIGTDDPKSLLHVSNSSFTRSYTDLNTVIWNGNTSIPENTSYRRLRIDINVIRSSARIRLTVTPENTGGVAAMVGSVLEGDIWRADGGAVIVLTNIQNGSIGAGAIRLLEPTTSGNAIFFGFVAGNNGTSVTYNVAVKLEMVTMSPENFTFEEVTGTTPHTGDVVTGTAFYSGDGARRLDIDSAGNVGIGVETPSQRLDVREENTGGGVLIQVFNTDNANTTTQTAGIAIGPDSRGSTARIIAVKENADFSTNAGRDIALTFSSVLNNTPTERMRIDASGNVGIGIDIPLAKTHIYDATTDAALYVDSGSVNGSHARFLASGSVKHFVGSGGGFGLGDVDDFAIRSFDNLIFATNNSSTERMRIDSSGNVSIGDPDNNGRKLRIYGTGDLLELTSTNSGVGGAQLDLTHNSPSPADGDNVGIINFTGRDTGLNGYQAANITGKVGSVSTETGELHFGTRTDASTYDASKMILDAIGNLLVGTTSTNPYTSSTETGAVVRGDEGILGASRSGGASLRVNRIGTGGTEDGDIAEFRSNGSTVGTIGVDNNDNFYIGATTSGHSGFYFGNTNVAPMAAGTKVDNTIDLGTLENRFIDLHLSGGVVFDENPTIVGTTVGARTIGNKTLDDYEEGTWTTVFGTLANLTGTPVLTEARYTKIGNLVSLSGKITGTTVTSAGTETTIILDLPFLMDTITAIAVGSSYWPGSIRQSGAVVTNTGANSDEVYLVLGGHSWTGNGNLDISFTFTYQSA